MNEQSFYAMRTRGKLKIRDCMLDYKVSKWVFDKWVEGYTTAELANALHCGTTTIKRAINPFKMYYRKKPLVVPDWVIETMNRE